MSPYELTFSVPGVPRPQGSKTAIRTGDRARVIEAGTNDSRAAHRAWRDTVTLYARNAAQRAGLAEPWDCPMAVVLTFHMPRPKLWPLAKVYADTKPDLDKLTRAVLDSLTDAGVFTDDSRVVWLNVAKVAATGRDGRATGRNGRTGIDVIVCPVGPTQGAAA